MILVSTEYGMCTFKVGSLLFDFIEEVDRRPCVRTARLRSEIIDYVLPGSSHVSGARSLAELFWALRKTNWSFQTYATIKRKEAAQELPGTVPWIGDSIWRPRAKTAERRRHSYI